MIIGTGGSRIVSSRTDNNKMRNKTLLEVSESLSISPVSKKNDCTRDRPTSPSITPEVPTAQEKTIYVESQLSKAPPMDHQQGKENQQNSTEILSLKSEWVHIVSSKDISCITRTQQQTSRKFEETNEMLHQFNILSDATFSELQQCYKTHGQILKSLKTELNCVFQRVRTLKAKLESKYPESFQATSPAIEELKERNDLELEQSLLQCFATNCAPSLPRYSDCGADHA